MFLEDIKKLRAKTDMPVADCRKALQEADGDFKKALEILSAYGSAKAEKKSERVTKSGVIQSYVHFGSKIGVLLELRCETDFVANTDQFKELARDVAMHIAAMKPIYISDQNIPQETIDEHSREYKEEFALDKYFQNVCLLSQFFIKNQDITIKELIDQAVGKLGEKIEVTRFVRYEI